VTAVEKLYIAPNDYLESERVAEEKSEYVDGEIYAMSGATFEHNQIASNTLAFIHGALRERPCQVLGSDMKVWLETVNTFAYPDISGLCGPVEFYDDKRDIYSNPQFIIEVLSDSTESYDRGDKFFRYQSLTNLREYVLISQKMIAVEVYRKQGDDWLYHLYRESDAVLRLDSVDCAIPLSEIYRNVEFQEPPLQSDL